jgi:protease-4
MSPDQSTFLAEEIIRIKNRELKLKRWRNLALGLLLVLLVQNWKFSGRQDPMDAAHIAVFNINEVIDQYSDFWNQFGRLDRENAKAALILMNSPGGTPGDSERLYNEIELIRKIMPVTVLVENQATSGAYLASLASDRIYAYNSAIVGSIGIVSTNTVAKVLFEKIGIEQELFTVGQNKGYPNHYEKTPPHVVNNLQQLMQSDQNWFLGLVVKRRNLDKSILPDIKEAQVYSAIDGLTLGLIDGFSTRHDQIEMLRDEVGDLPIKNLEVDEAESFFASLFNPKRAFMALSKMVSYSQLMRY